MGGSLNLWQPTLLATKEGESPRILVFRSLHSTTLVVIVGSWNISFLNTMLGQIFVSEKGSFLRLGYNVSFSSNTNWTWDSNWGSFANISQTKGGIFMKFYVNVNFYLLKLNFETILTFWINLFFMYFPSFPLLLMQNVYHIVLNLNYLKKLIF